MIEIKILKGKKGDVCPINQQLLKTYKHPSVEYLISPCLNCPHQKISWISKEGFVTVKCRVDEVENIKKRFIEEGCPNCGMSALHIDSDHKCRYCGYVKKLKVK